MKSKNYIRDKRSPTPKSESVSRVMSSNKAKNTQPELILRKAIWEQGVRGYRVNYKQAPGKPDIAFPAKKVAVFINGCFWHRCPKCNYPLPKNNTEFWKNKFEKNINRDKQKASLLQADNWKTVTVWECDIKENINNVVTVIKESLD